MGGHLGVITPQFYASLNAETVWEHPLSQMEVRGSKSKLEKSQAHAFKLIEQYCVFVCIKC